MRRNHHPTGASRRFWRRFDRWALGAVLLLQGLALLLRRDAGRERPEAAPAPDPAREESLARRHPRQVVAVQPAAFGSLPQRRPVSRDTALGEAAWGLLRQSPALDMCEHSKEFELRLSVPNPGWHDARAYVVGRRVDIDVPLRDATGAPAGRLYRQVLLPTQPHTGRTPRIEHTNGILRVFVAKP